MIQFTPGKETSFLIEGPNGLIEGVVTAPEKGGLHTAIICHPHPLFGGTMQNKVVTTLSRVFQDKNIRTVRFNFRGVGKSEGVHDRGIGEAHDLLWIAEQVKLNFPDEKLFFAGFSFGGYVAARGASRRNDVETLISVAPQVSRFKEDPIAPITIPWIIVQGEEDEVVDPESVYAWIEEQNPKPTLIRIPNAGHYFHGKLIELREVLREVV